MFFFSRGEQVALALLMAALVAAGGAMWWASSHAGAPPEPFFVDAPAAKNEQITVHVCGEVARPGLYTVAAGSRAYDVIKRAGGATGRADLDAVNLAAEVIDGQQLNLPALQAPASDESASPPVDRGNEKPRPRTARAAPSPPGKVNLNRAGVEELDQLPGIGPTYARRIVEYRERLKAETGQGFTRIEQLMEIPGIGPRRFADIKDRVTL